MPMPDAFFIQVEYRKPTPDGRRVVQWVLGGNEMNLDSTEADNEENAVRMAEMMVRDMFRRAREKTKRLADVQAPILAACPGV